jgi:hypothetical protein
MIGLPQKDGHDMPLVPYQRMLYDFTAKTINISE